jgi:hypothetical protein
MYVSNIMCKVLENEVNKATQVRMKMEQKYPESNRIVFYI